MAFFEPTAMLQLEEARFEEALFIVERNGFEIVMNVYQSILQEKNK